MPRDPNGVYHLPSGYLAETGETIVPSQHNPPLEDIAQALTNSVPRAGTAAMLADLPMGGFKVKNMADGTADTDAVTKAQLDATVPNQSNIAAIFNAASEKTTPVDADRFPITDSADSFSLKRLTFANIKATLTSAFNSVYLLVADVATAAQYRNNTAGKVLRTGEVWSAMAVVALSDAATISWVMSAGIDFSVSISGNRTLSNPTSTTVGKKGRIKVTASGADRTLNKGSNIKSATTFPITISSGTSAYLYYDCVSSTEIVVSVVNGAS